jgi:hypothetical protein
MVYQINPEAGYGGINKYSVLRGIGLNKKRVVVIANGLNCGGAERLQVYWQIIWMK